MDGVKLKYQASVILEPLIALTIISIMLTVGVLIFSNLSNNNNGVIKFKAEEKIDSLSAIPDYEPDIFDFETFTIEKEVDQYTGYDDLIRIDWIVYNQKKQELFTFSQLKRISDEN